MKASVALVLPFMLLVPPAQSQSASNQPIRIIVPFTPGAGPDTIARAVSVKLAERLGRSIIVVNTPGASGNIGADSVAKAPADGGTLLMGTNTMLIASQMYPNVPFDPRRDFRSVSMAAYGTLMLVASHKSGIASMDALLTLARASPGSVTYGSPGYGTPHHMAMELFRSNAGIAVLHVPYKGTSGYVADLLSGELMVGFLPIHVAQGFVASGKLVPLAVGSPRRHHMAPSVSTIDELGLKGVNVDMWYAFFVAARTPPALIARLNAEVVSVMAAPDIQALLATSGLEAASSSQAELEATVARDYLRWGAVIKANSLKAE